MIAAPPSLAGACQLTVARRGTGDRRGRGRCGRSGLVGRGEPDERADRRHSGRVDDVEHVVAGRRGVPVRRHLTLRPVGVHVKASGMAREFWSKAWVTDPVRMSSTRAMLAAFGVATNVFVAYLTVAGTERDRRPRALEHVGRRVDLRRLLVRHAGITAAPRDEDPAVGEEEGARVVEARHAHRAQRCATSRWQASRSPLP